MYVCVYSLNSLDLGNRFGRARRVQRSLEKHLVDTARGELNCKEVIHNLMQGLVWKGGRGVAILEGSTFTLLRKQVHASV